MAQSNHYGEQIEPNWQTINLQNNTETMVIVSMIINSRLCTGEGTSPFMPDDHRPYEVMLVDARRFKIIKDETAEYGDTFYRQNHPGTNFH